MMKFCTKCQVTKLVDAFSKAKNRKDGLNGWCKECIKGYCIKNKDRIRRRKQEYRLQNLSEIRRKDKIRYDRDKKDNTEYHKEHYRRYKGRYKQYMIRNADYIKERMKKHSQRPEVILKRRAWMNKRYATNLKVNLNQRINTGMNRSLRYGKQDRKWESLIGYTVQDLIKHLEKLFTEGMGWDNMDKWHIDHIIPVSAHNFSEPEDEDFKRAWALKNLQPLWAKDNRIKSDNLDKPFQPTLI